MNTLDQKIQQKLLNTFEPTVLDVQNESHMHSGTATDSHYKVIIVSRVFEGQRLITRHRSVNQCLAQELEGPVHALAIHTYTEDEWEAQQGRVPLSPNCMGGSKSDKS
ncbi:BolA family protein [Catenovulum sediminis]|uniref:BolA/IbaG family iron-sulfur metabolism protein n=1 Tax=Catenovulum sediminis TaxID=1740262 RepID=A0ABV1RL07_9ALTE